MIWLTTFNPDTKECTAASTPTQFNTIAEVVAALGEPIKQKQSYVVYEGMIYSVLKWHVTEEISFL